MLRAVIIDDELIGINTLKVLIEKHTQGMKVVAIATEPEKGIELIEDYKPDVVFLDINMPRINGFQLLETTRFKDFKLVFTTAYQEHAIKAIKKKAFDYLLKPIHIEELKTCVESVLESLGKKPAETKPHHGQIIELSVKNGIIFIKQQEIIRLEADRSYTIFYLTDGVKHVASKCLKEFEVFLDPDIFYRCHPSHIINLNKVVRIISDDGLFVQMSDASKPELLKRNKQ
ncbi:MAG: LytTR family DNA-binding domain-containing protein, partial [Bacteroidota bacterium]